MSVRLSIDSGASTPGAVSSEARSQGSVSSEARTRANTLCSRAATPGAKLHGRISAANWCITKADLKRLRRDVKLAVTEGRIVRTSTDLFDPNDTAVGPNIYTVVEQLIKPMTRVDGPSGGASYALTHHPDGMECDVYITHAWSEGVYEFIDKVLSSWPWGKRSAYACMLSNPQHGDLAGMISDPSTSPFARALERSTHVLAVPNQSISIYTRLWCCYEAYLAYIWGKEIFTAWTPVRLNEMLKAVRGQFLTMVCVAALTMVCITDGMLRSFGALVALQCTIFMLLVSFVHASLTKPGLRRTVSIYTSSVVLAFSAVVTIRRLMLPDTPVKGLLSSTLMVTTLSWVSVSVVPMLLAVDAVRETIRKADIERLGLGFSGSVLQSSCTMETDKNNIFASIGGATVSVDQYIHVLLTSGMSTASTRKGASLGVAVERLSFIQWGPAYLLFTTWFLLCLGLYRPGLCQLESVADVLSFQAVQAIYPVIHLVLFAVSPIDQQNFIVYVAYKLLVWLVASDHILQALSMTVMNHPTAIAYNVCGMLSSVICAMGLGRLASIPVVGSHFARFLVGKAPPVEAVDRAPA